MSHVSHPGKVTVTLRCTFWKYNNVIHGHCIFQSQQRYYDIVIVPFTVEIFLKNNMEPQNVPFDLYNGGFNCYLCSAWELLIVCRTKISFVPLRKKEYLTKLNGNMVKLKIRVSQLFSL